MIFEWNTESSIILFVPKNVLNWSSISHTHECIRVDRIGFTLYRYNNKFSFLIRRSKPFFNTMTIVIPTIRHTQPDPHWPSCQQRGTLLPLQVGFEKTISWCTWVDTNRSLAIATSSTRSDTWIEVTIICVGGVEVTNFGCSLRRRLNGSEAYNRHESSKWFVTKETHIVFGYYDVVIVCSVVVFESKFENDIKWSRFLGDSI